MSTLPPPVPVEEIVQPDPAAIVESLRSLGYTVEAAIADLVDNSVSAGCTQVQIEFSWDGENSYVSLSDDGRGMDEVELVTAMRLGSRGPTESRGDRDLGRFGLGLKTASFSQCRDLSVYSRREGANLVARRWDLNHVVAQREWLLLGAQPHEATRYLEQVPHGSVVLWRRLDRLVPAGTRTNDAKAHTRFLDRVASVEQHLRAVFGRFLSGPTPIKITVNSSTVVAWDPFLLENTATQWLASETISVGQAKVIVQPYVLPHSSKLSDAEQRYAAGKKGWNAQQGFYVYRSGRLLVDGSWLGLGLRREEHCRLARIAIEIPTSLDLPWNIDVKKSVARPPDLLLEPLARIARITRERATEIYRHRGKVISREQKAEFIYAWKQVKTGPRVAYRINRNHPLFDSAMRDLDDAARRRMTSLLSLLEQTIPAQYITIQGAEDPDAHQNPYEGEPGSAVHEAAQAVFSALRGQGLSPAEAARRLRLMEPFCYFLDVVSEVEKKA